MEARRIYPLGGMATVLLVLFSSSSFAQFGQSQQHVAHSQNFIVFASTPQLAARVSAAAEKHRRELSNYWLGKELPAWSQRCPLHVQTGERMGAGGETRFSLMAGGVGNWMMSVTGTEERVLDSVLPHEITHTIFATHFAPYDKYVPRWADEGACTTVEHVEEKSKHEHFLQEFLRSGRGIAFAKMFSLKDYPKDILPLYAQGHSVVQFLLNQGGPRRFVGFLEDGMQNGAWEAALTRTYQYESLGELQLLWNKWLADGSPKDLLSYAPSLRNEAGGGSIAAANVALASNTVDVPSNAVVALASGTSQPTPHREFANNSSGGITSQAMNLFQPATNSPTTTLVTGNTDLASLQQSNPAIQKAGYATGPSWYRQRLREVTSGVQSPDTSVATSTTTATGNSQAGWPSKLRPTPVPSASPDSASPAAHQFALQSYQPSNQAVSRPMQSQSPGIQVLDWGNSQPVPGLSSASNAPTPLLR